MKAERMVGTAGGGADQTISIMGQFNTAKLIDFSPSIKATDVKLPDTLSLVVANSMTSCNKVLSAGTKFNKRVVECRLGVGLLAVGTGLASSLDECSFNSLFEL